MFFNVLEFFVITEGKISPDLGFFLSNFGFISIEKQEELEGTFSQAKKLEVSFFSNLMP